MCLTLFNPGGADLPPSSLIKGKKPFSNNYISPTKWLRYLNWVKLGHILKKLDFRPFFELFTPSRSSGERLGADLSPPHWVLKGSKNAGFYMVKGRKDSRKHFHALDLSHLKSYALSIWVIWKTISYHNLFLNIKVTKVSFKSKRHKQSGVNRFLAFFPRSKWVGDPE